ncbi:MAG: GNAT family N-acetyltransferase [Anaerolineae bacterium]
MLTGARLTLRAVTRDDLPRYVAWLNDGDVTKHLSLYLPMNLDDETEWYESQRHNQTVQNFAIETRDGKHIGSVGLMDIDYRDQSAELGIVIGDKTEWGKGYGREAIGMLLDFAFNTLNLNRICLQVDTDHPAAIKCYRNCGFVQEGELRHIIYREGRHTNQYLMSILKSEYRQRQGERD